MKAITLWEPWATLVVEGLKEFETRSWYTSHRGPLVIHAAKTRKYCKYGSVVDMLVAAGISQGKAMWLADRMRPGHIRGVVDLKDVFTTLDVRSRRTTSEREIALGDYGPNRFAWRLEVLLTYDSPFPALGRQQFWVPSREIQERITEELSCHG